MKEYLIVILLSLAPVSELRGAIPTGLAYGIDPVSVFLLSVIFNSIAFFPIFFGLEFFYDHVKHFKIVKKVIERARKKGHEPMKKYGVWGLIPFVAIPFPVTGAWTGTIIAWLFDLEWWKSFIVISIGVIIAGLIVSLGWRGVISFSKMVRR